MCYAAGCNSPRRKEIWTQADSVFNTSVLLNVYRCTDAARAELFKLLSAFKAKTIDNDKDSL
jgi:hypothetical protein